MTGDRSGAGSGDSDIRDRPANQFTVATPVDVALERKVRQTIAASSEPVCEIAARTGMSTAFLGALKSNRLQGGIPIRRLQRLATCLGLTGNEITSA